MNGVSFWQVTMFTSCVASFFFQILQLHSVNLLLGHPGGQLLDPTFSFCSLINFVCVGIVQNFFSMRHANKEVCRSLRARELVMRPKIHDAGQTDASRAADNYCFTWQNVWGLKHSKNQQINTKSDRISREHPWTSCLQFEVETNEKATLYERTHATAHKKDWQISIIKIAHPKPCAMLAACSLLEERVLELCWRHTCCINHFMIRAQLADNFGEETHPTRNLRARVNVLANVVYSSAIGSPGLRVNQSR